MAIETWALKDICIYVDGCWNSVGWTRVGLVNTYIYILLKIHMKGGIPLFESVKSVCKVPLDQTHQFLL